MHDVYRLMANGKSICRFKSESYPHAREHAMAVVWDRRNAGDIDDQTDSKIQRKVSKLLKSSRVIEWEVYACIHEFDSH